MWPIRLSSIDPVRIFSLFRAVQQIRRLVQSVPKNDRIDDLATTGAAEARDADLTAIVLEVQVIVRDQQPPAAHTGSIAGERVEG